MTLPRIHTTRLRFRPYRPEDLDDLHRNWTDPLVRRFLWDDVVIPREQAEEALYAALHCAREHGFGQWTLSLCDGRMIGFCGFRPHGDAARPELLFGLAPDHWGQGLATEAARAALRCGFEEHQFPQVLGGADLPNAASRRVLEKIGMRFEYSEVLDGRETFWYGIARDDFRPDGSAYALSWE